MFESIAMSVVALSAGASLTFILAVLLPEPVAAKSGCGGLYAALGEERESNAAPTRRANAPLPWRTPRWVDISRRRARSACPARAH